MRARKLAQARPAPEIDHPTFRVRFGEADTGVTPGPPVGSEVWDLDDVDVDDVLAWAEERSAGRPLTVWALAATDPPNEPPGVDAAASPQVRLVHRVPPVHAPLQPPP